MIKYKGGFTIIEVSLFLAITGLLFLAVTIGVQNSIFQQRYNDAVQDFSEFLRRVYSETMNVQSSGAGRSQQAIYGKLVTFGESVDLNGGNTDNETIFMYDVVGDVGGDIGTGEIITALKNIKADVIIDDGSGGKKPAGIAESYRPKWSSEIQPACASGNCSGTYVPFKGALLVVRHPRSGSVFTFVMNNGKTVEVNEMLREGKDKILAGSLDDFVSATLDVCVNPNGNIENNNRADVRIERGASNSSAIEVIYDREDNACK